MDETQTSEAQSAPVSQEPDEAGATLLFVDDEANILSALKRLFRPLGYTIFTAESGAQGLDILARESVDLVVSDMRMPEMNGAQFLEKVREKWPETVRILLTGYAEMAATIEAINKGQIYRYVSKPWEDNDFTTSIRHALQQKMLEQEKRRLEELTRRQNEELKELNASLEDKVKARTEELRKTMERLEIAHERLKKSFITSIRVFSNLIEMRDAAMMGHSRRVAELARTVAQRIGMSEAEVQDVFVAGLLLDIGKMGLPDRLLKKPLTLLTDEERCEMHKYPAKGQMALMALEQLHGAALLIRSHRERFDGFGFPDKLMGAAIPLGARVLAVANDYDEAQLGVLSGKRMGHAEAVAFIRERRGKRYDAEVVDAFLGVVSGGAKAAAPTGPERVLSSEQLRPGMILSRDFITGSEELLLSKGHVLTDQLIGQIRYFERLNEVSLAIYVLDKN